MGLAVTSARVLLQLPEWSGPTQPIYLAHRWTSTEQISIAGCPQRAQKLQDTSLPTVFWRERI